MDLFQNISIPSILWIAGLATSLIAFVGLLYQKRRLDHDPYGYADELAWIVALYFSLALFCLGLALNTFSSASSLSIWVGNIWLSLALLLFIQAVLGFVKGIRHGWHEDQLDGGPLSGVGLWMGVAALLLAANLGLVLWAGLTPGNDPVETESSSPAVASTAEVGSTPSRTEPAGELGRRTSGRRTSSRRNADQRREHGRSRTKKRLWHSCCRRPPARKRQRRGRQSPYCRCRRARQKRRRQFLPLRLQERRPHL